MKQSHTNGRSSAQNDKSASWLLNAGHSVGQRTLNIMSRLKLGYKIAALVVTLVLAGLIVWFSLGSDSNKPAFDLQINAPTPVQFHDDQPVTYMVNDSPTAASQISLPGANNDRTLSGVQNLRFYYSLMSGPYSPVFKMDLTDKDLENNIKIRPFIKGKWTMAGSDALFFTPSNDWPAGQKFTVTIGKKLFNPDIKVNKSKMSFSTQKLEGKIESFDVYPNLSKKQSMIAIGVISFNYPIDTKTFADKVSIKLDKSKIDFSVKFDAFYRTAFITSDAITLKDVPQKLRMTVGDVAALSGNATSARLDANVTIESQDNFFKVSNITTSVVDNQQGNPDQLVILNLTSQAKSVNWSDYVDVYLLPQNQNSDEEQSHDWKQDEITDAVLKDSQKLKIKPVDFINPAGVYQYAFAYDVSEKETRYIYVSVKPGIMSDIGFALKNGAEKIMPVPYPPKEVKIAGSGALLSLSGGQKLGIVARGGANAAYVNLFKVKSSEINHLITQTYHVFSSLDFRSYSFGPDDMSVVFNKKIPFADTSLKKVNYSSVDLGDYLNRTGSDRSGIFIVQTGTSKNETDYSDRKLILLTDLGIIRKQNSDGSSSIFIASLATGLPISGVSVSILGRNGNPVWSGETNSDGRVNAPRLSWEEYRNEKEPVVFVARQGSDVSFIPYSSDYEQQVEFSKFDVDGVYEYTSNPMNAYLFSDRGIYRPGEELIIGGIVKEKTFKSLAGVPVKIDIRDTRDKVILEKTFALTADGMFDIKYRLAGLAPIGDYQIRLYSLNDKNKTKDILGTTNLRVEEFTPDTLKINVSIAQAKTNGWINTSDIKADVTLRNLFGTPAQDRRISARAVLTPVQFSFPEYTDYQFTQNFIAGTGLARGNSAGTTAVYQTLPDVTTDKDGHATTKIQFENNINPGTYVLSLTVNGFDGGNGKSVQAATATKVSDAEYLIGFKPSSDLAYINKGAKRSVNLIAINSDATQITADKLTLRLVKKEMLTSLIKDYDDYYKYQTVSREKVIKSQNLIIPQNGMTLDLETSTSGTYYVQVLDADEKILANIDYFVAGAENLDMTVDQQAELKIKLNQTEYAPGAQIDISITSPYIGAGLITIEKDKVYAAHWFKTDTTASVQRITLPENFEGNGYVNVSFVRDINSRDIFTTPYTYAVAPFAADKSKRTIKIDLTAPDIVRDNKLTVRYETNKSARMMIFATNEGILQVAKYQTPKPLTYFFQKAALQVNTFQILSLLLPEYKILREFAKTGGGDYDELGDADALKQNMTNPFARAVDNPVAFYSGIIDTTAGIPGAVTFDIPNYFNGAVRVYAVAANNTAMGSATTDTKIQSPVIISPSVPLMAVPGDKFNVNAVISNMTQHSGPNAQVKTSVTTSDNLMVTSAKDAMLIIPEMSEKLWTFDVTAGDRLGNADIDIMASVLAGDGKVLSSNTSTSTLSVRPESLFETNVITAFDTDQRITIKDFQIDMYKEQATKDLYISSHSSVLVKPLFEYLNHYSFPCSEQTVSKALPYALFPADSFLKTNIKTSTTKITDAINILKNRQNDDGSFAIWEGGAMDRDNESNANTAYVTAYVVQFLSIAKENGFNTPSPMLSRAVDYLRTYVGQNIQNDFDAATHAFAVYLISRNGFTTTSAIGTIEEYADANIKTWQSDLTGAYVAASYKILKQDDKAESLIKKYKLSDSKDFVYSYDFSNNVVNDATYMYLVNKYFDGNISKDGVKKVLDSIQEYIASGNYSSFTSAVSVMALSGATASESASIIDSISVMATVDGKQITMTPMDVTSRTVFQANIPTNVTQIEIKCADCNRDQGVFYTLIQQGFPKTASHKSNGIEITRAYYNADGDKISSGTVGDDITVKIFARTTGDTDNLNNVIIADLLPAGFLVVPNSITGPIDFFESREDRVLAYTNLSRKVSEIKYQVRPTATGIFTVPGIQAASLYNPQIMGAEKSETFKVTNAQIN